MWIIPWVYYVSMEITLRDNAKMILWLSISSVSWLINLHQIKIVLNFIDVPYWDVWKDQTSLFKQK